MEKTNYLKGLLMFTCVFLSNFIFGQDSLSNSMFPKECFKSIIYVEKYEPISLSEMSLAISTPKDSLKKKVSHKKTRVLEFVDYFNHVSYRELNLEIDEALAKNESKSKAKFVAMHKRDILLESDSVYRFIIRSSYSELNVNTANVNIQQKEYYLYDRLLKIKYKPASNLDALLFLLSQGAFYTNNQYTSDKTQAQLDKFVEQKIPKPRVKKGFPLGGKIAIGVILYLGIVIGGNIIGNL